MSKKTAILFGFILLKFILQYVLIIPVYDLQRDEYLHLNQAQHPAWGYLSVPPFTSWISYLIYLLGNTVFWVKFFPALFGALTLVVVWKTIETLNGNLFALILGSTCVLVSALLRLNTLFQPNSFDVFSWTCFYFLLIKYLSTKNNKWLYWAAICFAFGFLNKYNILFLLIGIIPAILLSAERKIFLKKELYLATCLALLMVLPNLLWQYRNNFPVIHHLNELAQTQLVHVNRFDFLKAQLLFFMGALVVIIMSWYALLFYKPFKPFRLLIYSLIFTLAAFMYFKAKDYYAIGLYPIYIALGAVFLGHISEHGWKKYLRPILIAIPLVLFIPFFKIGFPNKTPEQILQQQALYKKYGLLRWEDGKDHMIPQDFADMLGWKELAEKTDSIFLLLPNPEQTLILCDNYGQAGAINYYTKNKNLIAESFNADYISWLRLNRNIKDVILVKEKDDEDKNRNIEKPLFDSVYLAVTRVNFFAREDSILIYVLRNAKTDVSKRLKDEAQEKMSKLR